MEFFISELTFSFTKVFVHVPFDSQIRLKEFTTIESDLSSFDKK